MPSFSHLLIFFFESVYLFMAIFFFLQYSILRKPEYLWYSLYLLLLFVYYPLAIPELFFSVQPAQPALISEYDTFKRPTQFMISVCYSLFVIYYLGLRQMSRPLYKIFVGFLVIYVLMAIFCLMANLLHWAYDPVYYTVSLLLFPMQMYAVIALFRYKVKYGKFIIWGSINVLLGSTVTLLLSLEVARNPDGSITNAHSYIPVMIAIMVDIFLFTIALQRKIADNEISLLNAAHTRHQAVLLERERIIADLHDDVGGGLSSIRMMSDLMVQENGDTNSVTTGFPAKISSTVREVVQRMNTIIWSLNQENDSLENFIEYVRHYGLSFFETSPINFLCVTSENLPWAAQISGVTRKNLFLIIKEALHNSFKHSAAQNVQVHIYMEQQVLHVEIEDDGKGLGSAASLGNGKRNMRKRADEINGVLEVISANGTTIHVAVPF